LTDLIQSIRGLLLGDTSEGGLSISLKWFGSLRDLVAYELAGLLGSVSRQPQGLLGQEMTS